MGRLAGFKYHEVAAKLRNLGFELRRQGKGSHEVWFSISKQVAITLPHHAKALSEGTLRAILRDAQIDIDTFLST